MSRLLKFLLAAFTPLAARHALIEDPRILLRTGGRSSAHALHRRSQRCDVRRASAASFLA